MRFFLRPPFPTGTLFGLVCLIVGSADGLFAAEKADIDAAIERGKQYLLNRPKTSAEGSLACYALVKAGVDKQHPDIQKCLAEVFAKCRADGYLPTGNHTYEAGVDALLLDAVDREKHLPQLEMIAKYLIAQQRPYGGWYYPLQVGGGEYGDTSISQYAILGLWAASRAGVEIPTQTLEKAALWLMRTQRRDGGFAYHPADSPAAALPQLDTTATMTVAGTGSLLIIRRMLFGDVQFDEGVRPAAATTRRFGVLERLPDEKDKPSAKPKLQTAPTISASAIDKSLKEGVRWCSATFGDWQRVLLGWNTYYFYGVERVAALLDVEKLGTHDWYDEGADELLRRQSPTGSWDDSALGVPATSLALLFLTKATAGGLTKPKRTPVIGGGLLVGGRGLPDNLDTLQVKEGEVTTRKLQGPIDGLLAELEKSSGAKVEATQAAVVEAVQLDRPEELIGQVDRLKRLATDTRVEVRRTAMWALGRTGIVSVAPYLIQGLEDSDEAVAREASLALIILSRRPNGIGQPIDPTDGLKEDASNEERATHLSQWRKASVNAWKDWYLKVRPYDERDDRTSLKRKP